MIYTCILQLKIQHFKCKNQKVYKLISLRPYQQKIVNDLREAFIRGKRSVLLQLPTGGGKTFVFCYIADGAKRRGNKVLILTHRTELLLQASQSLLNLDVWHSMIAPNFTPNYTDAVQVASVQTLAGRLDSIAWEPDLIVPDEAHHACAGTWSKILNKWPNAKILGVTATPCRTDGRGLGDIFDKMVQGPSMRWLMDDGFLTDYVAYSPANALANVDLTTSNDGDFNLKEAAFALDKPVITGDAVEHYRRICPGAPAIAFCSSIEHARHVAEAFREGGFNFQSLDGKMDPGTRKCLISDLAEGRIHGLTSCDIISEGTDIPVVTAAILLRPTQSEGLFLQQVGRALRPVYDTNRRLNTREERLEAIAKSRKPKAIILDHVGNLMRHGLPDDDRNWTLDYTISKKSKDSSLRIERIRQCEKCFAAHRPALACPNCGHGYVVQGDLLDQIDGDLSLVDPDKLRAERERRKGRIDASIDKQRKHLEGFARAKGYKDGWVEHKLNARRAKAYALEGLEHG
jgi:DNA repair protein RadD